jgi:glutamine synthetase
LGEALDALEADSALTKSFLGEPLAKAYLAVRRHEMERSSNMSVEDEVQEALS